MATPNLNDLVAFLAVARERSFTKAAAKLGTSQPALSQTVRELEARLGVHLLTRTTRSVAPTEAGARLVHSISQDIEHITGEVEALNSYRDKPFGIVRVSLGEHAARTVIWPKLPAFLKQNPDVKVELTVDQTLTDIVAEGYDAGVRIGERLAKDMIGIRIGPRLRMVVVGSPDYLRDHEPPTKPQDLTNHECINLRLPTMGGLLIWEFEKNGRAQNVRVEGHLILNNNYHVLMGALASQGLAYIMEDVAKPYLESGQLRQVLADWCPTFDGYHLYYPSKRQGSSAFNAFVNAMRYPRSNSK